MDEGLITLPTKQWAENTIFRLARCTNILPKWLFHRGLMRRNINKWIYTSVCEHGGEKSHGKRWVLVNGAPVELGFLLQNPCATMIERCCIFPGVMRCIFLTILVLSAEYDTHITCGWAVFSVFNHICRQRAIEMRVVVTRAGTGEVGRKQTHRYERCTGVYADARCTLRCKGSPIRTSWVTWNDR